MRTTETAEVGQGRSFTVCLLGLLGLALQGHTLRAETTRLGMLPGKPRLAGFAMQAELEVLGGNGYQPIHLTFTPIAKAFPRDRHLMVQIRPQHDRGTELDFTFRHPITLPQGSTKVSRVVYVPHYYPWQSTQISLYEDGRLIENGSSRFHLGSGLRARFAEQFTSVGVIAPSDMSVQDVPWKVYPDVRTLVTVLGDGPIPEDATVKRLNHQAAMRRAAKVQPAAVQFRPIEEDKLHKEWLGYSQLDIIIVAHPVLERIAKSQPEEFNQLLQWLAAGGSLWVYAVGDEASGIFLDKLALADVSANQIITASGISGKLNLKSENDTSDLVYQRYGGVQRESQQYSFRANKKLLKKRSVVFNTLKNEQHPFADTAPKAELAAQLHTAQYGLGKIVTIALDDPFPGSFQFWNSIANLHTNGQVVWVERMGIDVPRGNDNYWMWLIPAVGQPPVKSFLLLNSMFVILVGPICYFFFRRRHRLYLLYFCAPALALLVTGSLFAYALAADGTRTKVRSRQLTWIDSHNGCAVDQSRQTYYAVFGSRGGLQFPRDAAVYPVRNTPAYQNYSYGQSRSGRGQLIIDQDSQRLAGSFFPTRSQVQYLVTRPRQSETAIELSVAQGQETNVISHLPYTLSELVVRDSSSRYWRGENITSGEPVVMERCYADALTDLLGEDVLPPLGSVPMLQQNLRRRGNWGTGIEVSMLEERLDRWSKNLPRGGFVARADINEENLGLEGAIVMDSVRVIMGVIP